MKTICFDVDGVLADFTGAFGLLLCGEKLDGTKQMTYGQQGIHNLWDEKTWHTLRNTRHWWQTLDPLVKPETFHRINDLSRYHRVYFVTNRYHDLQSPADQTSRWLMIHGVSNPSVIVTAEKAELSSLLEVDFFIEDNWDNARAIGFETEYAGVSHILDRPYNVGTHPFVTRVQTVEEFLDIVEASCKSTWPSSVSASTP